MFNRREAGVNFLQTKYKLLDNLTFIPYIRSNNTASIPHSIIDNFGHKEKSVAFLKIYNRTFFKLRIKKLHLTGNSQVISLKAEKNLKNLKIQVVDIKTERELLDRNDGLLKYIPKFTLKGTPIYFLIMVFII